MALNPADASRSITRQNPDDLFLLEPSRPDRSCDNGPRPLDREGAIDRKAKQVVDRSRGNCRSSAAERSAEVSDSLPGLRGGRDDCCPRKNAFTRASRILFDECQPLVV